MDDGVHEVLLSPRLKGAAPLSSVNKRKNKQNNTKTSKGTRIQRPVDCVRFFLGNCQKIFLF